MIDQREDSPTADRKAVSGEAARRIFIKQAGAAAAAPAVMLLLSAATTSAVAETNYTGNLGGMPGVPGAPGTNPVECPAPPPPVIVSPPPVVAPPPPPPPPPAPHYITRDRSTRAPLPGMPGAKRKSLLDP